MKRILDFVFFCSNRIHMQFFRSGARNYRNLSIGLCADYLWNFGRETNENSFALLSLPRTLLRTRSADIAVSICLCVWTNFLHSCSSLSFSLLLSQQFRRSDNRDEVELSSCPASPLRVQCHLCSGQCGWMSVYSYIDDERKIFGQRQKIQLVIFSWSRFLRKIFSWKKRFSEIVNNKCSVFFCPN